MKSQKSLPLAVLRVMDPRDGPTLGLSWVKIRSLVARAVKALLEPGDAERTPTGGAPSGVAEGGNTRAAGAAVGGIVVFGAQAEVLSLGCIKYWAIWSTFTVVEMPIAQNPKKSKKIVMPY